MSKIRWSSVKGALVCCIGPVVSEIGKNAYGTVFVYTSLPWWPWLAGDVAIGALQGLIWFPFFYCIWRLARATA